MTSLGLRYSSVAVGMLNSIGWFYCKVDSGRCSVTTSLSTVVWVAGTLKMSNDEEAFESIIHERETCLKVE